MLLDMREVQARRTDPSDEQEGAQDAPTIADHPTSMGGTPNAFTGNPWRSKRASLRSALVRAQRGQGVLFAREGSPSASLSGIGGDG